MNHQEFKDRYLRGKYFICPICHETISTAKAKYHLATHDTTPQNVYDSEVGRSMCKQCCGPTIFISLFKGYGSICSATCQKLFNSDKAKEQWKDPAFHEMMSDMSSKLWQNPEHLDRMGQVFQSAEFRSLRSKVATEMWKDENRLLGMIAKVKEHWVNEYKDRVSLSYKTERTDPCVFYVVDLGDGYLKVGSGLPNRPQIVANKMHGTIVLTVNTTVKAAKQIEWTIISQYWNPTEMMEKYHTIEVVPTSAIELIQEVLKEKLRENSCN